MLIIGFDSDSVLIERLRRLAPTVEVVKHPSDVNQHEFDLLVTDHLSNPWPRANMPVENGTPLAAHLSVIYRSDGEVRSADRVQQQVGARGGEFTYPDDLPRRLRRLVVEQLVPIAQHTHASGNNHRYLEYLQVSLPTVAALAARTRGLVDEPLKPFLSARQGRVLAGWYRRSDTSECWVLPPEVDDLAAWVDAAIEHLHDVAPERFPLRPGWEEQSAWQTTEERRLIAAIDEVSDERQRITEQLAEKEFKIRSQLANRRAEADLYERGLLNLQGAELVQVVAQALTEMGFRVADMDATVEDKAQLLEDLQVTDPAVPDWIALVEVRGYTGGAKTNDFQRIARFAGRYLQLTGRLPSARWYVVNHDLDRDPTFRPPIFGGQEEDVAAFAEDHGLVIETRQLFKLLMVIRDGRAGRSEVLRLLREGRGLLAPPAVWEGEP